MVSSHKYPYTQLQGYSNLFGKSKSLLYTSPVSVCHKWTAVIICHKDTHNLVYTLFASFAEIRTQVPTMT